MFTGEREVNSVLDMVAVHYRKSPGEYMRFAFVTVASIYGVDIMANNVAECRDYRLSELLEGGERQVSLFDENNKKIDWEYGEETSGEATYSPEPFHIG